MDINDDIKKFLLTAGNEYVKYIKERDKLIEAEKLAWENAELASKLLEDHRKKNKDLDKKMKEKLFNLVENINLSTQL
jgi:polyhydroxyalkanoate synthesis regulator phasin